MLPILDTTSPEQSQSAAEKSISVGERVRIKKTVKTPCYGWGSVSHKSIGTLKSFDGDEDVVVNFPECSGWNGKHSEIEAVPPGRFTLIVEGGGGSKGCKCNGSYVESGQHNGKPLYVQKDGAAKIYFNKYWKIGHDGDTGGWVFGVNNDDGKGPYPPNTWRNDGYGGTDATPCPTLKFIAVHL
jgi:hypothetical protein